MLSEHSRYGIVLLSMFMNSTLCQDLEELGGGVIWRGKKMKSSWLHFGIKVTKLLYCIYSICFNPNKNKHKENYDICIPISIQ